MKQLMHNLTKENIENELKREMYKIKFLKVLKNTIFTLIIIGSILVLVTGISFPILKVSTSSMKPYLNEGDIVFTYKTKKIKNGDVIAFYHGNKILIKRVIATSGSFITIDTDGSVYVDGVFLSEDYVSRKTLKIKDIEYPYQVGNEEFFVLSDDRENIFDSRNKDIGCVSYENIIGKVLFKV